MSKTGAKQTLSLCMIVKDAAADLPTLWQSVKHIVNEWIVVDTGSTDNTVAIAKKLGAQVFEEGDRFCDVLTAEHVKFFAQYAIKVDIGEKIFHFGKARTSSFKKATKDFILWLDADDLLIGSQKLRELMALNLDKTKQLGIHLLYKYEQDAWGTPITEHYRERVFPNLGTFKWEGRIHEIIIPTLETQYIRVAPHDVHVLHNKTEAVEVSGLRNVKALLLDLFYQKDKPDPRTLFQLAEAIRRKNPERALKLYKEYIVKSGWDEEQHIAAMRVCDLYLAQGDNATALNWAYKAMQFKPDFPGGYGTIAECYYALDDYHNCILFSKQAEQMPQPDTLVVINQKHNEFTPLLLLTMSYFKIGNIKECKKVVQEALKFEPKNDSLLRVGQACQTHEIEEEVSASYKKIHDFMVEGGEVLKAVNLLSHLPSNLREDPRLLALRKAVANRVLTGDDTVREMTKDELVLVGRALKGSGARQIHFEGVGKKPIQFMNQLGFTAAEDEAEADAVILVDRLDRMRDPGGYLLDSMSCLKPTGRFLILTNIDPAQRVDYLDPVAIMALADRIGMTVWNTFMLPTGATFAEILPGKLKTHKKSIAFVCGPSFEEWGPHSIYSGLGGSEEAVVYLSRELAYQGHEVTIFNNLPQQSVVNGVRWKHYSTIRADQEFETGILWRVPHHVTDYPFKAKTNYLWLHDVPQAYWFTPERTEKIDHIIALSEFHKTLLPKELQERVIVSQNGVDLAQFKQKIERRPHNVIYTSSYDRGLEHLLGIWPEVRKAVPDAELHIYYGWGMFDNLRKEEHHKKWKTMMMDKMKNLPGVFEHGRIGHIELAKEFLSSSVYAYPCHFEEISCISVMKAQVAGCFPLTTDYAALAETNLSGLIVKGNPKDNVLMLQEFQRRLIDLLKTGEVPFTSRSRIQERAINHFSWKQVAKQWSKFIEDGGQNGNTNRDERSRKASAHIAD